MLTGTSLPSSVIPGQVSLVDKILHFAIYAFFAILLTKQATEITGPWRAALIAIVVATVFGAADEWHQNFIPGRSAEFADWKADTLGAIIGSLTTAAFLHRRSRAGVRTTA